MRQSRRSFRAARRASLTPLLPLQAGAKDYRDRIVCRHYLEGLCPHDLFVNTVRRRRRVSLDPPASLLSPPPLTSRPENVARRLPQHSLRRAAGASPLSSSSASRHPHAASPPLQDSYLADKAAGKVNYESELREHLTRQRGDCDRRVQRAAATIDAKDPEMRTAPSVSALVDCPEAHAMDTEIREAEALSARHAGAPGLMDPLSEARLRALIDTRAMLQAASVAKGFSGFAESLHAKADAPRQAELAAAAAAKLAEAETAGEEGRVEDSVRLVAEAEAIQRIAAQPPPRPPAAEPVRGPSLSRSLLLHCSVSLRLLFSVLGASPGVFYLRGGFAHAASASRRAPSPRTHHSRPDLWRWPLSLAAPRSNSGPQPQTQN